MIGHDLPRRHHAASGNILAAMRWAGRPEEAALPMIPAAIGGTAPATIGGGVAADRTERSSLPDGTAMADGGGMLPKTELVFFVVETRDGWLVRADGFVYGPYKSSVLALHGAVHEAQAAGNCGFASLVLIQSSAGEPYETVWTYGRNTYPFAEGR